MTTWVLAGALMVAGILALITIYVFVLRPWHMRWGATTEEMCARLPGDEVVERSKGTATHAITINASSTQVWPWLVKLGQDRAGFYSYTQLENLFGCHMRNTYRVVPEWQQLKAGDGVLFHPKVPRVPVAIAEPNHALVLGGLLDATTGRPVPPDQADENTCLATSWAFVLLDAGTGHTRLIARLRGRWPDGLRSWLINRLFWEPAHFIMERKMLLNVKRLAESLPAKENPASQ